MYRAILFLAVSAMVAFVCALDGYENKRESDRSFRKGIAQVAAENTIQHEAQTGKATDPNDDEEADRSKRATTDITSEMLAVHNKDRKRHHVGPLSRSSNLAYRAQQCAQRNANRGYMGHDCPLAKGYGENLVGPIASKGRYDNPTAAYKLWYNEKRYYNYRSGGFSAQTGHFTQVVWKGTRELGCGRARASKGVFVNCLYNPPGNYAGRFQSNVLRE